MTQPNILLIMADQLRLDRTGFGGNPIVKTPNLDALAARGQVFTRAYCNSPSCGPSRNSLMTGRMPSANGSWTNALSLDWDSNTFVRVLRQNGYRTGLIGKSHLQDCIDRRPSQSGKNKLDLTKLGLIRRPPQGEGRAKAGPYVEAGQEWDKYERHWFHKEGKVTMPEDYYGFDTVELTLNHDDIPAGHHYHWIKEKGGDPEQIGGSDNALETFEPWGQVWKSNTPLEYYTTTFISERSMAFMDEAVAEKQPFFLTASYPDPHHPFGVPEPYYSLYNRDEIPIPETFQNQHEDGMPHLAKLASERGKNAMGPFTFSASLDQYREATAVEYGSITLLDEGIGRLMSHLETLGIADNTLIIFCADHGDLGGDHGLMLKFAAHYQGVLNIPLVIAGPNVSQGQTDSLASLLDVGQTILDVANCQPYIGMQGRSLVPILEDHQATVRDSVLIEESYQADFLNAGKDLCLRTLVTEDARLTMFHGLEDGELYDLGADPLETNNLYNKPEGQTLQNKMMAKLIQEMMAHRDLSRYPI
ncbi:MAG: sulfatase-like hydrolase/transferase [Chloroflexota bacterium]